MNRVARRYLDYNATAPLRPEVADAVLAAMALPGNPSSVHAEGRAARAALERTRESVAALVGADPRNVVFTSGGTEAANAVLSPLMARRGEPGGASLLLAGATEHACVLDGHGFAEERMDVIPVDRDGVLDLAWLARRLEQAEGRVLLSLQAANNETGVLQPVAAATALVRERGGFVHSDAVQAAGRIALDIAALGVDMLTLSAHKLGGPKGVGAIVLASDRIVIDRRLRGGGQERGLRAGTENVAGIVGFGVAAEIARREQETEAARLRGLRDRLEANILRFAPEAVIFGRGVERLPNTVAFSVPGWTAETALIGFDLDGIAVSSGAACSSGKVRRSHVLDAMGVAPSLAEGAIRLSLGWNSCDADVECFAAALENRLKHLYRRRATAA